MEIFTPILGAGVGIAIRQGTSLREMLCGQLKMPADYLENRIQTILLNGHAVDTVDRAYLAGGDVIALSAAMPGLVGAILRKGGPLSPMRAAISQRPSGDLPHHATDGIVTLKLFNMVVKEMGPQVLASGIWLDAGTWSDVTRQLDAAAAWRGKPVADDWVVLIVTETPGQ